MYMSMKRSPLDKFTLTYLVVINDVCVCTHPYPHIKDNILEMGNLPRIARYLLWERMRHVSKHILS